jgi:hypothetical protein
MQKEIRAMVQNQLETEASGNDLTRKISRRKNYEWIHRLYRGNAHEGLQCCAGN